MADLLLCIGHGYVARALAAEVTARGTRVVGTYRAQDPERGSGRRDDGPGTTRRIGLGGDRLSPAFLETFQQATQILVSVPPDEEGDPVLRALATERALRPRTGCWIGYLSTTAVYGDTGGAWVDEDAPVRPGSDRARRRVAAEDGWRAWANARGADVHIFRLAGIYGPGRNLLVGLRQGTARRVHKAGQVFSRIHVADVAQVLTASMAAPLPGGEIYNVCDDEPAAPWRVTAHAAGLLGVPPPPIEPIVAAKLSTMAASFYAECRRVQNRRIKNALGVVLRYPTYREGLAALAAAGEGRA